MVEVIRSVVLDAVPHGFLTRRSGVSSDAGDPVLAGAGMVTLAQVHSAEAVVVDQPWDEADRPRADALVTARPGLLLGIVTADCAPVLLADSQAHVIGAAHAGWKGARGGVIEATVAAMEELGARRERIAAAIGPCIAQASYEVGVDFRAAFAADDGRFFAPGQPGHLQFDLESCVAARLVEAGVGSVDPLGLDTYRDETRFYSYRRANHRGEASYGRQLSLIGLPGDEADRHG